MKLILTIILSFLVKTTVFSQSGFAIEYLITTKESSDSQSLLIFSKDGNTFSRYKRLSDNVLWYRNLRLKSHPKIDYQIFDSTYVEIPDEQLNEYEVTVIGKELVDSMDCLKISLKIYKGGDKTTLWISKKLPSYESYMDSYVNTIDLRKLKSSLKKIGQEGFPIKIVYNGNPMQTYQFVKGVVAPLEDSLFNLDNLKRMELTSSEELRKNNQISNEQYQLMKIEEERAKQQAEKKK